MTQSIRNRGPARNLALWCTLLVLATACNNESLEPPIPQGGDLFARYVALGNSITAGFESGGINDSTQRSAYPVLLAESFGLEIGATFTYPAMAMPGCPPPLANVFTGQAVAPGSCFARSASVPRFLNNVAVPGAAVIDLMTNLAQNANPNPFTSFFLGGRTQLEATAAIDPTFLTIWIGNNDVLGALFAADAGSAAAITPPAVFTERFDAMMDEIDAIESVRGGVLIGVVQVVFAPYATSGPAFAAVAQSIPTLTVDPSCLQQAAVPLPGADSAVALVPFHVGAPLFAAAVAGTPTIIDCAAPEIVSATEAANMLSTVAQYNVSIAAEADERGWAYWDPNVLLGQLIVDPTAIRPFPAFDPLDPQHETAPFGTALSRDGFHPSTSTQQLIADALAAVIDLRYGSSISAALARGTAQR